MNDLSYYLKLKYPIVLFEDVYEGRKCYEAEIPDLPGCVVSGETKELALENLEKAKRLWLKASLKKGLSIPEPVPEDECSKRFLLRIPVKLYMQLMAKSKQQGLSLNQFIKKNLEKTLNLESIVGGKD